MAQLKIEHGLESSSTIVSLHSIVTHSACGSVHEKALGCLATEGHQEQPHHGQELR
jgi:hypothetical protein